jgi:gliding motility-associated-like protein
MQTQRIFYLLLFIFGFFPLFLLSQNQQNKWYFGQYAALDFMQNPPTPILNSVMLANFGSASQADENGNILFYTNGLTVYNKLHAVMANGTGLLGDGSPYQGCLIVQKPGSSSLYYIFTIRGDGFTTGFNYSIVDMSLSSGQGSVTTKNAPIYNGSCTEAVTGALHCNGIDYWLVIHERTTNNFRAYLLSSAGVNTTAVITSISPVSTSFNGAMKISSDGSKLAMTTQSLSTQVIMHTYDFDNTTGVLSNHLGLPPAYGFLHSLEFSQDGSKLYCGGRGTAPNPCFLHQWDLCAGTSTAIAASHYSLTVRGALFTMQLATNGKIYISTFNVDSLAVINDPNFGGSACNFVYNGQTLGGKASSGGLQVFIKQPKVTILPFSSSLTSTQGCHAMSFTANIAPTTCASSNYSVLSVSWDFGDPSTGTLNVSSSINPVHVYSSSGTFTTTLIFNYKCGADTIKQVVQIPPPNIAVSWSPDCVGMASATVVPSGGVGPYTYSWSPSSQTNAIASNLNTGTYSVAITDLGLACKVSSVITVTVNPIANFNIQPSNNLSVCVGSSNIIQLSGNCTSYLINPSIGTNVNAATMTLSPSSSTTYTVTGSLNSCTVSAVCDVIVLSLPSPSITMEKNKACLNADLKLFGFGGSTYDWKGPGGYSSQLQNISRYIEKIEELGTYTLDVFDQNGCKNSTTKLVEIGSTPSGELTGFNDKTCVPFWSDFVFKPSNNSSSVFSSWTINKENFGNTFRYLFTVAGTYTVQGLLTDTTTKCTSKLSYFIEAHPKPKAQYYQEPERIVENSSEPVFFINSSSGEQQSKWAWYFYLPEKTPSTQIASGKIVSKYFPETGNFVVAMVVTNKWNCADTIVNALKVEEDYNVWVPNTFTPNDDSRNDLFLVVVRGVSFFNLKIFNRWGKLIFHSNDVTQGWDGTYMGQPSPDGVYNWIISTTSKAGEQKIQTGNVNLFR